MIYHHIAAVATASTADQPDVRDAKKKDRVVSEKSFFIASRASQRLFSQLPKQARGLGTSASHNIPVVYLLTILRLRQQHTQDDALPTSALSRESTCYVATLCKATDMTVLVSTVKISKIDV